MSAIQITHLRDTELGAWTRYVRAAPPAIRSYASHLSAYHQVVPTPGRHVTPANFTIPLVIQFSTGCRVESPGHSPVEATTFIAGLGDDVGAIEADHFTGLQVDLTPIGAYRLTSGAIGHMAGTAASLDDLFGPPARLLVERLGNTEAWEARLEILEDFLTERIGAGPLPSPEVIGAWETVARRHGAIRVDQLASDLGWSVRHLRQRIGSELGVSPKVLARLARFQHASRLLERSNGADLGHIAALAGYYDQAHLTNEWKRMAGRTPLQHLRVRGNRADFSKTAARRPV